MDELSFRQGTPDDAAFLAHCVREVSGGVVDVLLKGLLPGIDSEQLLSMVLRDTSQHYSHKNCVLGFLGQNCVGLLFAYPASEQSIPPLMRAMLPKNRLEPLMDILTAQVPESLYINTFWVESALRGSGLADSLMDYAKALSETLGLKGVSLFAFRNNARALAFYARHGFQRQREVSVPCELLPAAGPGDLYFCER
ncbi:MAG: GNAT family N-acetyltransferase [Desulfovibrio sp.]|nr:GNAT family N-acetyltransferase [Desulfovibrio sp.]